MTLTFYELFQITETIFHSSNNTKVVSKLFWFIKYFVLSKLDDIRVHLKAMYFFLSANIKLDDLRCTPFPTCLFDIMEEVESIEQKIHKNRTPGSNRHSYLSDSVYQNFCRICFNASTNPFFIALKLFCVHLQRQRILDFFQKLR